MKTWELIFLIFSFVVILSYLHIQATAPQPPEHATISSEELLDTVDNGDLIFFSGDTPGERTCRWCTSSPFSHVGFLFREEHPETKEDVVYIFECDLGQGSKDGVRVMRLTDKLERYKGFRVGAFRRLKGQRPSLDSILSLVAKYSHLEFDNLMVTWWFSGTRICDFLDNSKTVFCSELVAKILQDLGILERGRVQRYSPADFFSGDFTYNASQFFSLPGRKFS